ncbi:hypothetical protein [Chitiniphilus eburneus]|uniref:hypothetical protein n=1 Tax=Chitiniphilus eburneus TaxID=2571148 RepID=UPI0035CE86A1
MNTSRPVVAFALLQESSKEFKTDLLGGICLLINPIIQDLNETLFDPSLLSTRLKSTYGIEISPLALTDFIPRFIEAKILTTNQTSKFNSSVQEVFFNPIIHENKSIATEGEEEKFQLLLSRFEEFCNEHLKTYNITVASNELIDGLLNRLATFNFHAIQAKPDRTKLDTAARTTILGATAKEDQEIEKLVSIDSKLDVLVAAFISHLSEDDQEAFDLIVKVGEGALAAQLVLDLQAPSLSKRLDDVTIILDTPILLSLLNLSSVQQVEYARLLKEQIIRSGAKIGAFTHSIEEAEGVLHAIKTGILFGSAYGPTASRLRNPAYRAYVESMEGFVRQRLSEHNITIIERAANIRYQHFSGELEEELTQEIQFSLIDKRLARERDALSVAETIRYRNGAYIKIQDIPACQYLFLTTNSKLQSQSKKFLISKKIISKDSLPPILTDRYFSGLTWLMYGGEGNSLPRAKLLSNCASALRDRPDVIRKTKTFLNELKPELAAHFEALMTNDRAAAYMTEITLGDSLLITQENVLTIYAEVELIAAERVSQMKDEEYGKKLNEKEKEINELSKSIIEMNKKNEEKSQQIQDNKFEINHLKSNIELISNSLQNTTTTLKKTEEEREAINRRFDELEKTNIATQKNLRNQEIIAIKNSLKKAKDYRRNMKIVAALIYLILIGITNYIDKYPQTLNSIGATRHWPLIFIASQILISFIFLGSVLNILFKKTIQHRAIEVFKRELSNAGYGTENPTISINLENFTLQDLEEPATP